MSGLRRRSRLAPLLAGVAVATVPACGLHTGTGPRFTVPTAASRAPTAPPGGLLWRVRHGDATSHLFGTVHLGRALDEALGPSGREALAGADVVAVEVDLDDPTTMQAMRDVVTRRGRLPPGRSLERLLTPSAWRFVADTLGGTFSEAGLARLQPWLAVHLVVAQRAAAALQPGGTAPTPTTPMQMDRVLMRRARARGQRLVPLETVAEQLEAFAAMPEPESVALLEEIAHDPAAIDRQLRGVVDSTRGPHPAARVERVVAAYALDSPSMAEVMLYDRTERWVPRIEPLLRAGDVFVAVGAGHLVGRRGLVALLRARGFQVDAVGSGG
jgi:uncharacterized protein YbaP (TraB family)